MVVVALRGPRIRAPPNVIATLIRRHFNGLRGPPVVGAPSATHEGIKTAYEMGWIHAEPTDRQAQDIVCVLPSKLHQKLFSFLVCYFCFLTYFARFLEYHLSNVNPRPFPYQEFPTLHALCEATLRRFSRRNLLACTEGRLALSAQIRPPEAQFQDEFYRALNNLLGSGVAVSSEWSRCGDGRIDFRIVETGWGVKMLRDGDRLSGHCGRFVQGGSYDRWINQGWIKDWIVLDCRHSRPLPYGTIASLLPLSSQGLHLHLGVKGTKLWRVIFSEGYSSACVWDSENQVIIKEFPLMN
jgi:hypothetical protein